MINLPPPEIIKEIIKFVGPFTNRLHYWKLCLVCKEWNEYVHFLLTEKHRLELPEMAIKLATDDLIQLFKYALEREERHFLEQRSFSFYFGFSYNSKYFHEYYSFDTITDKGHILIKVVWSSVDSQEIIEKHIHQVQFKNCIHKDTFSRTVVAAYDYEIVQWLRIWLPLYIFNNDQCAFDCDGRNGYAHDQSEPRKICEKYTDDPSITHINREYGFMCRDFLQTVRATPIKKFCKLLFQ